MKSLAWVLLFSLFCILLASCSSPSTTFTSSNSADSEISSLSSATASSRHASSSTTVDKNDSYCVESIPSTINSSQTLSDAAIQAYSEFLDGKIDAQTDEGPLSIYHIFASEEYSENDMYAYYDMNGDSIPELHIRSENSMLYQIFTYTSGQVVPWGDSLFTLHCRPTDDRTLFYTRYGAAPPHITYQYFIFDYWGNEILRIYFEKYDINYNNVYDERDDYLFQDVLVTKEQWDLLTQPFMDVSYERIDWILFK